MRYFVAVMVVCWLSIIGGSCLAEGGESSGEGWCRHLLSAADQAEYDKYIGAGFTHEQMACWCQPYQCHGDVDGQPETYFKFRIYMDDLDEILRNWKKKLSDPTLNPCADVDHKGESLFQYRVYIGDLNRVLENWKKRPPDMDVCIKPE
jgi:hypothetical protein